MSDHETRQHANKKVEAPALVLAVAAVAACCGLPLLLVTFGGSGAPAAIDWLGLSPWLVVGAMAALIAGLLWYRRIKRKG